MSLFGGPYNTTGPTPTVTLTSNASNNPQTATAATGSATAGPVGAGNSVVVVDLLIRGPTISRRPP
jgi:hypothetical protein